MTNSSNNRMESAPVYVLDVQSASPYEVYFNDILVDSHYDAGSVDYTVNLNQWILSSGEVTIRAKIYTSAKNPTDSLITKTIYDYFMVTLSVYEKQDGAAKKHRIQQFKFKTPPKELPVMQENWSFYVKVPYQLKGWGSSINLSVEDSQSLKSEAISLYSALTEILNKGDIQKYNQYFRNADAEFYASNYCSSQEIKDESRNISEIVSKARGKTSFKDDYSIKYHANGKIISLENNKAESPLRADLGRAIQYFSVLLHRPGKGAPLQVIR